MADVLLIQPPIQELYLTARRTVPHGLACLAGPLRADGFDVEILDALATTRSRTIMWPQEMSHLRDLYGPVDSSPFALFHSYRHFGRSFEQIADTVRDCDASLVGIASLFTPYAEMALQVAETVKAVRPQCTVVLGGHHPTALPAQVMAHPAVDYVIRGEGEDALPALARALRAGQPVDGIGGLVWREGDSLRVGTAARAALDRHPPATDLIDADHYRGRAVVVTSRGCPMRCSYCCTGAGSELPYRRRSVASVLEEISAHLQRGIRFIDFEDENLALDGAWLVELLERIVALECPAELRAMNGLLPHTLDQPSIALMRRAGFRALNLSLGSSDPEQLRRWRRTDEREAFDRALAAAEAHGLGAVGYVIAAAPGQEADRSVDDLLYLAGRRVLAGLSIYYPAPGSEDHARCAVAGLLPDHLSLYRSTALPIADRTSRLQAITLLRLARILGFIKAELDRGAGLPAPAALERAPPGKDRRVIGRALLAAFLYDGIIRGLGAAGELIEHPTDAALCCQFVKGLGQIRLRGTL